MTFRQRCCPSPEDSVMTVSPGPGPAAGRLPIDLRQDRPTPARMYDYFLGGKDNYAVDREAAERVREAVPNTREIVWENRFFLQRAVRYLASSGIDQFVDLGTGLPTQGNVHEIAGQVMPSPRVVYVDNDPIVLAYGRSLLAGSPGTTVITADMREPDTILADPDLRTLIDLSRPTAVLLVAVLHFITDSENPAGIVKAFRDVLAPGSYLVLSHLTTDGPPADAVTHTTEVYANATSPIVFRTRDQIAQFFDGFALMRPGLVRPWQWHPEPTDTMHTRWLYAGVGKISERRSVTATQ
jgi:SAM-dependent methyltransferase